MGQPAQERAIALSPEDRKVLVSLSGGDRRGGEPLRAAIVLTAASGLSYAETARRLATTRPTVATWLRRYAEEGVPGLRDRVRPGRRPRVRDADVVLRTLTTIPSTGGAWSSRALGVALGLSNGTVARIWRRWGLRPTEPAAFRLPGLPDLALAGAELVGLHCGLRDRLLVLAAGPTGSVCGVGTAGPTETVSGVGIAGPGTVIAALTGACPAARDGLSAPGHAPARPGASGPPSLADFLAVADGRPDRRLHVLAAGEETVRRQTVRDWAAQHGHEVRVAPAEPTWTELAAVAAGLTAPITGRPTPDLGGRLVAALRTAWRTAWFSGQPCHWLAAPPANR
ncbi:helix-turn-helix domain-containing protein [Micromonospora yasonensis]|uniref:helix-turn-helix domain-containing protein n=1 Tax=Micromonospora yasonensis TaxID=1128667 RepID=UPI00222ED9D6|nr:helix-turn-helix domain-containing protein [Micromonospora yasonensis]MCW3842626.1 helix-turn-helix domain-containing protein [Micromonospora yasonensis]